MRIAVYASGAETGSHYRAFEPMLALGRRGHQVWINDSDDRLPPGAQTDVALIARYAGADARTLVKQLRQAGAAVVWDLDDSVHQGNASKRSSRNVQRMQADVRAMLQLADVVTTTNEELAEEHRALGARCVHAIANHLGDHYAGLERRPHDGLVLGWAAWSDHQTDWQRLGLHETVCRLLDAHPALRVESVGLVNLELPPERYTRTDAVPFAQLARELTRFDIGIAPIVDTPFNRARSDIKVKEYAAAGAAWLASPIGPYAGLGEREGGRLVPDDGWYEGIDALVSKPRLHRKLAKRGRRWAAEQLLAKNVQPWETALMEAVERARSRRRP